MKDLRFAAFWVIVIAVAVGSVVILASEAPPADPLCRGIPLSVWIKNEGRLPNQPPLVPEEVRVVGPVAATYLAYAVAQTHPWVRDGVGAWAPKWLQPHLPQPFFEPFRGGSIEQCEYAIRTLASLGPDAEPTIPFLVTMVGDYDIGPEAADTLNAIGPASWPATLELLEKGNLLVRRNIIRALPWRLRPPAPAYTLEDKERVIGILLISIQIWSDASTFQIQEAGGIRALAASALGECRTLLGADPSLLPAVPALINCVEVRIGHGSAQAAETLAIFGSDARAAILAVTVLASEGSKYEREIANKVLAKIR